MNRADILYEMYHEFMRDPVGYADRVKQIAPGFDTIRDVVSGFQSCALTQNLCR